MTMLYVIAVTPCANQDELPESFGHLVLLTVSLCVNARRRLIHRCGLLQFLTTDNDPTCTITRTEVSLASELGE